MAFQIIDDILDYTATDEEIGKKSGKDLEDGIYTLPLILSMKNNPEEIKKALDKDKYSKEEIDDIIRLVRENGGVEEAKNMAERYSQKAFRDINKLPDNEYKQVLFEVTEKLISRKY